MKNKYIMFAAMAAVMGLSSCDMDKTPYDSLLDTDVPQTVNDFKSLRVGLYSGLRGSIAGDFYNAPEVQADCFNAVNGFSNTYGDLYYWSYSPTSGELSTVYASYQALISRANFLIDGYNKCNFSDTGEFTERDIADIVRPAKGDAFFTRAYAIFMLSQYFCDAYDESTANNAATGVSYRTDYNPSNNAGTYPGRKTLAETYKQVSDDLDSAAVYVKENGEASSKYVSQDAITALRARLALNQKQWAKAAEYATGLIDSEIYTLASDKSELEDLFYKDGGMETIFQLTSASVNELPSATGSSFLSPQKGTNPDFIPTQSLIDLYASRDNRKKVFFTTATISTNNGASGEVYLLNKYPEQGGLYEKYGTDARFRNEPKVFRIAEMYLIAAESYAQLGDVKNGGKYLNELMKSRITRFSAKTYADKTTLLNEVKNERERELVGEGFRLFDLKRWGEGIKRGTPQNVNLCSLPGASSTDLAKDASDYHFTWPIPREEMQVNPQLKGQQNRGWGE